MASDVRGDDSANLTDLRLAVLRPRGEVDLAFMVSLLEAKGIPYHVKGAYFGGLYAWPPIENYNARTVLIPEEDLVAAQEALAGIPGRGRLARRRMSGRERALVVIVYLVSGWPMPCLPPRFRFLRSLALAVVGASILMTTALLVFLGGALVANWWEGMTAGRGVAQLMTRPAIAGTSKTRDGAFIESRPQAGREASGASI